MQIVTGRRGEPHVTSRQMQAVYRSFLGDFALLDIGEKLRAEAYSNDIVRVYDGVVSVQGIYAVIAYNQYDEVYIEPVSVGKKRIDTIVLHYTKDNALDVEDMQLDVVQGEEYTDNPIAPVVPEGGDAWEGTTDIQVAIYDVEVTNFGLTVTPYARMLNLIPTLESIAERIPETVVTGVKGDSEVLYRDGNVNITKANIGLGNVDNTADTDKPISTATQTALNLKADLTYVDAKIAAAYHAGGSKTVAELTSALLIADNIGKVYNMSDSGVTTSDFVEGAGKPINEGDNVGICNVGTEESPVYKFDLLSGFVDLSAYATTSAVNTALAGKVDKVAGKGLSTEDYTTTEKTKLTGIEAEANKTVVDSAMSDSSTNPLQNKVITKELEGAKTTSGNPITVTDAAPVNAVNLSMDLEPIQDLHGYDHPWVGGAGKNKLPMTVEGIKSANTSGTWSGNTYTLNGVTFEVLMDSADNVEGIKVNGTTNAVTYFDLVQLFNSTEYAGMIANFSGAVSGTCIRISESNRVAIQEIYGGNTVIVNNGNNLKLAIRVDYNKSPNTIIQPMIRLSTESDSTFEPYSNISPITGQTEVVIDDVGKNLYDKNNANNQTNRRVSTGSGGTYTANGYTTTYLVEIESDAYYTLTTSPSFTSYVCWYDETQTRIDGMSWNSGISKISPSNAKYIRFDFNTADVDIVQFELGSTATEYEPYAGKTYTIQIGQTVYGGQLDVTRGKMVVDRGYIASYNGETLPSTWISDRDVYASGTTPTIGAEVVYELATPITIPLTPQQIKLLENTNTIYTDYEGDTITLEYQPNNAIGEAVRAVEESYDPEFAVRPVLKKKAFSGTTDSDGAVTLINASDIPSGHKIIPLHITDMTINGSAGTYFVEYKPFNSGDSVKGYCYTYFNGSQITPVGSAVTGNFYYYELEV